MGMPIPFKTFTVDRTQITDIEKWIGDGNNLGEVEIRNFLGKIASMSNMKLTNSSCVLSLTVRSTD
jgi:hypothetical protein